MEILIISGLSGGGKSKAASFLEDMGFYIVDNIPAGLIMKFAEFCAAGSNRYSRVALVYDVRTGESLDEFLDVLSALRAREYVCRLLFLEADVAAIIHRYKETRRLHPLLEGSGSLEEAVRREMAFMAPVRAQADVVINSSNYSTAQLRGELLPKHCKISKIKLTISSNALRVDTSQVMAHMQVFYQLVPRYEKGTYIKKKRVGEINYLLESSL